MGRAAAAAGGARRALKAASWYIGAVLGDDQYDRYVDHRRRLHPDEPVLTEREFWRVKHGDGAVTVRCC